jgi:HAD superfamily hydrolase (TIGR01509 family)
MIKLFIFDMDGVLFDSEPIYFQINKEIYAELNIDITEEEYSSFIGIASNKKWKYIRDKHQLDQSVQELMDLSKTRKYGVLRNTKIEPMPGVQGILEQIQGSNAETVLASSSSRIIIEHLINSNNLGQYFTNLVSGEDVKRGKPEPDIFLKAKSSFNFRPGECMVIEDSQNGVMAAKAAGMKCIGFKDKSSRQDLSMADYLISSYEDFPSNLI